VPRRLIGTWWEATDAERGSILALVDEVRRQLEVQFQPDGFNVGFNAGAAAGQTVGHLHVHVIPRYSGDVPDPRGGVRHVIPGKGNYLTPGIDRYRLIDGQDRLLRDELLRCLRDPRFDRVDMLVSFVMKSGLEIIYGGIIDALDRGASVRVLTTDYLTVTDADALARLLDLAEVRPDDIFTRVFHDPAASFHPKAYLFSSSDGSVAETFVGSNNLSAAGIAGGIEWSIGADDALTLLIAFGPSLVRRPQPATDPRVSGGIPRAMAASCAHRRCRPRAAGNPAEPTSCAAGSTDGSGADAASGLPRWPGRNGDGSR
jgi:HKD family nuclease